MTEKPATVTTSILPIWWEQRREGEDLDEYLIRVLHELYHIEPGTENAERYMAVTMAIQHGEFGHLEEG